MQIKYEACGGITGCLFKSVNWLIIITLYKEGLQQNHTKAIWSFTLGQQSLVVVVARCIMNLGNIYHDGGDQMKKAKFHFEAAAMAGHNGGKKQPWSHGESQSGNMELAAKHWKIVASAWALYGHASIDSILQKGDVSRESIDSTLIAFNNSCVEMRSEARDRLHPCIDPNHIRNK